MNSENDYEKIVPFVYAMHRAGMGDERLAAMVADTRDPERAARAGRLKQRYETILRPDDRDVSDEELAQVLEEARSLAQEADCA